MLIERGRIVAVENDCVWVEAIRQSTCAGCKAQSGCGHSLLAKWGAVEPRLRVLLNGRNAASFAIGDLVTIGIGDSLVVSGALMAYLLPLSSLVMVAGLSHLTIGHEGSTALGAFAGLLLGGLLVRWRASENRDDARFHPVIVDDVLIQSVRESACLS